MNIDASEVLVPLGSISKISLQLACGNWQVNGRIKREKTTINFITSCCKQ
jgi:hypothetical protein